MKIAVLGGSGFIGTNLCEKLIDNGHSVCVFCRSKSEPMCSKEYTNKIVWIKGDFSNSNDVEEAIQGSDIVYHLVSTTDPRTSNENPVYDVESNIISSLEFFKLAIKHKIGKIIFVSSGGTVYGVPQHLPISEAHPTDPICSYGISKLAIEKYLGLYSLHHNLQYTILRLSNPYGKYQRPQATQGAASVFLNKAINDETVEIWGDGQVIRDYIYISDVVSALIKALDYSGHHKVFNVGSGVGYSLVELLAICEKVIGRPVNIKYSKGRKMDVPANILDVSTCKTELHWAPKISLQQGLSELFEYFQSNNKERE